MTVVTLSGGLPASGSPVRAGPYQDTSNNLWLILNGSPSSFPTAHKSTDGGATWTPLAQFTAFSGTCPYDTVFDSANGAIYLLVNQAPSATAFHILKYTIATNAWTQLTSTAGTGSPDVNNHTSAFLMLRSNGTFVVVYQGPTGTFMGSQYRQMYYVTCTSAGVWGTPTLMYGLSASAFHVDCKHAALGASDRVHALCINSGTLNPTQISLSSANVLDTAQVISTPNTASGSYRELFYTGSRLVFTDGVGGTPTTFRSVQASQANNTWASDTGAYGAPNTFSNCPVVFAYDNTTGTLFVVYRDNATGDIFVNSTSTTAWTSGNATVMDAATAPIQICAAKTSTGIGVVWNDSSTFFDTFSLGPVIPNITASIQATATITAATTSPMQLAPSAGATATVTATVATPSPVAVAASTAATSTVTAAVKAPSAATASAQATATITAAVTAPSKATATAQATGNVVAAITAASKVVATAQTTATVIPAVLTRVLLSPVAQATASVSATVTAATSTTPAMIRLPAPPSKYDQIVLADAPKAFWALNDTTGTTTHDSSGNGKDGFYTDQSHVGSPYGGSVTLGAPGIGDGETAVQLTPAVQSLAEVPYPFAGVSHVSFECWVRLNDMPTAPTAVLIADRQTNVGLESIYNFTKTSDVWVYLGSAVGANPSTVSAALPADGHWHYYAATFNGSTLAVYQDGVLVGTQTGLTDAFTFGAWDLALGSGGGASVDNIAKCAIYDYALTAAQVKAHYGAGNYDALVGTDAPAGFWPLSDSSGTTAVDKSGNGYDLTYVGSPTLGVPGPVVGETAVAFHAASSQFVAPSHNFNFGLVTIEAWVYLTALPPTNVLVAGCFQGGSYDKILYLDASGRPYFYVYTGSAPIAVGLALVPLNQWTHLAGIADGSNASVYVNGVQVGTIAAVGATFTGYTGPNFRIADNQASYGYFDGSIGEVAIYDHALTPAQIAAHYAASLPSLGSALSTTAMSASVTIGSTAQTFAASPAATTAVAAAVQATSKLTATAQTTGTVSAAIQAASRLALTAQATTTMAASVLAPSAITAAAQATTSVAASVTIPIVGANFTATVVATGTTAAAITALSLVVAAAQTTGSVTASVKAQALLSASPAATTTASALLTAPAQITAVCGAVATESASVTASSRISPAAQATATVTAAVTAPTTIAATAAATGNATAAVRAASLIVASAQATGNVTAGVQAPGIAYFTPIAQATASVSALITASGRIPASVSSTATVSAVLSAKVPFSASAAGTASVSASVTAVVFAVVTASVSATGSVTAGVRAPSAVLVVCSSSSAVSASFKVASQLSPSVASTCTLSASVSAPVRITALVGTTVAVSAQAGFSVRFGASIASTATVACSVHGGAFKAMRIEIDERSSTMTVAESTVSLSTVESTTGLDSDETTTGLSTVHSVGDLEVHQP